MKPASPTKKIASIFVLIASALFIFSSCSPKEKILFEKKETFPGDKWNGFHKTVYEVDVNDTTTAYTVTLDVEYTPALDIFTIPIVFSIYAPNGGESHSQSDIYIDASQAKATGEKNSKNKVITSVVYKKRYFARKGKYKFQFFQKTSKFDIDGIKSITMKITSVPPEKN